MKKILLVTEVFPPKTGGSGRWLWELYRRLPRTQIVVAAGESPLQEPFDRTHDLRVIRLPLAFSTWGLLSPRGLWQYGRMLRCLKRLVRAENINALHCGKCLPEGLLASFLGLPYICYVHGEELSIGGGSRELRFWTRRVLQRAECVIANSRNTEGLLRGTWGVPPERLQVLHPSVDTTYFVPAPPDGGARAHLGWDNRRVVLTVGRLQKRKGHDMLIRALPAVCRGVPDVLYAIAGEGEERPALCALVAANKLEGHVQFLGELTDDALLTCYQQCDLFALPNRQVGMDFEGFGIVLLEAQACEKPVIAGDSGGTAETMDVPHTGLVLSCDRPDDLAQVLAQLLQDGPRRQHMGQAGRQWVCSRFDWESLAKEVGRLFGLGAVTDIKLYESPA